VALTCNSTCLTILLRSCYRFIPTSSRRTRIPTVIAMSDDNEGRSNARGIIGFILVFGVFNLILYLTTGFFIIPLK
jgi:hypothetical protein